MNLLCMFQILSGDLIELAMPQLTGTAAVVGRRLVRLGCDEVTFKRLIA